MRVNSFFTSVMLVVFFITSAFTEHPDLRAKKMNLLIRQIGHRLMLQAGDSTSSVLPVTETKEGTFVLRFENEFAFNHDSLMALAKGAFPKTEFPSGYTLTVHDCAKGLIVYGFQVNHTSPDILACRGRSQLPGCYTMEFTFPDFYEKAQGKKAKSTASVKADQKDQHTKLAELATTTPSPEVSNRTKTIEIDPEEFGSKTEVSKTATSDHSLTNMIFAGVLVLLAVTFLIGRFGKIAQPRVAQIQNIPVIEEPAAELPALGKFLFNAKGQHLVLGSEVIDLTDKECKVLELLHKNFGELIHRETLMQEVWINEGVITGRSLDMFVSKLRKKLSHDPDLRITNVHGKGYKLEIPASQVI